MPDRCWCFRLASTGNGEIRSTIPASSARSGSAGVLEELYATLVVKLHHTQAFETEELWRYAADFYRGKVG